MFKRITPKSKRQRASTSPKVDIYVLPDGEAVTDSDRARNLFLSKYNNPNAVRPTVEGSLGVIASFKRMYPNHHIVKVIDNTGGYPKNNEIMRQVKAHSTAKAGVDRNRFTDELEVTFYYNQ